MSTERGKENPLNQEGTKTMKKNNICKRGLNASINAAIAKNPNANPAEMDKALKEVAKKYGMTWRELQDWMVDHIG